jgi:hypothetical protein
MKRLLGAALAVILVSDPASLSRAADPDPSAILDRAIKALGGEDKLSKLQIVTWKVKGKLNFNDNESEFTGQSTAQGLDHYRSEFHSEFNGNPVRGVVVLNGDKGWRKFGDMLSQLDADAIANEKRGVYLQIVPTTLVPLKGKGFKIQVGPEEKVGDKLAVSLKVTGPDGKDFTLYFDKETGLPVKLVAKVVGPDNSEFTQETTYASYKEFDGVKRATKIEGKRDGERFVQVEVTEHKALNNVAPDIFAEPK